MAEAKKFSNQSSQLAALHRTADLWRRVTNPNGYAVSVRATTAPPRYHTVAGLGRRIGRHGPRQSHDALQGFG